MDGMPHDAHAPQLRTLLLTDLCDSTALVERLGDGAAATLFRDHDRLVLELQQRWRGRLIDRSDGLLLLFERPLDGLGFALDYRRGLDALGNAHRIGPMLARAGLHVGEVLIWRNSEEAVSAGAKPVEIEGLAKPFTARLMQLARPGQILLSSVVEPLVRRSARELGERGHVLQWRTHGRWLFKGVPEVQEVHEVGEPGMAPLRAPRGDAKARREMPLWRRPLAVAAEAVVVVGLVVGGWFMTRPEPAIAFSERDWVVVGDLRNLTGQTVLDDSLEQAFRISLEQSRYVNVLSDLKVRNTLARMERDPETTAVDREIGVEVAQRDGARLLILPTVAEVAGRVQVSAEVIDPQTQRTLLVEKADGRGMASSLTSIDKVTSNLRDALGEALVSINRDSKPLPEATTGNLDALRAYALGQEAFGRSKFQDARDFYGRAIELDPEFALAHIGFMRASNALVDLPAGLPHLERARALRARLPARDQLYLDAWVAEMHSPVDALGKWRQMAQLYPDFYPASANVALALRVRNSYSEGLDYALRAAASKNDFSALSWQLVGTLRLGTEDLEGAEQAFHAAVTDGSKSAAFGLAVSQAAQQNFDAALGSWPSELARRSGRMELVSIYMDQGLWGEASSEATAARASNEAGTTMGRAATLPLVIAQWAEGNPAAKQSLVKLVDEALSVVGSSSGAAQDGLDAAYIAVAAGVVAQRMGADGVVSRITEALGRQQSYAEQPPVADLYAVLRARQLLGAGRAPLAISILEAIPEGTAPFQARVALMHAYESAGRYPEALAQAKWISENRGHAYGEQGSAWALQSLNIYDSTLARLQASELLAGAGQKEEARSQLGLFDATWSAENLPRQLRVRRDAVLATFN